MPTKTEGGSEYNASAFAYVPDPGIPSTWKLRLEESPGHVTIAQLGRAAAAFSAGGFRGNRVEIPSADVAKAKARIRAAYRKMEVAMEDMPMSIREAAKPKRGETRIRESIEGAVEPQPDAPGDYRIVILRQGFTADKSRYYTADCLRHAATTRVFEGIRNYADHSDPAAVGRRGHRSIRELVGFLKPGSTFYDERNGELAGVSHVHDSQLREALDDPASKQYIGTSHDSAVAFKRGVIDSVKTTVVNQIMQPFSVDYVPEGNAGGRVLEAAKDGSDGPEGVTNMDRDELQEVLAEAHANLAETLTTSLVTAIREALTPPKPEEKHVQEAGKPEESQEQAALKAKTAELEAKVSEMNAREARRTQREIIVTAVAQEDNLSMCQRERVIESLCAIDQTVEKLGDRVTEACEKERGYGLQLIKEAGLGTRVHGNGGSLESKLTREAYEEKFQAKCADRGIAVPKVPEVK